MAGETYKIEKTAEDMIKIGFGAQASNDQIVKDAYARLGEMTKTGELAGGPILKIDGPASLPVAFVIAHAVDHRYGAVAVKDPKLGKYVVAVVHGGDYKIGDLVD